MNIYEIYPQITQNPIFKDADQDTVNRYLNGDTMTLRRFEADELVYSPDSDKKSVGLILRGSAAVTSLSGKEKVVLKTHKAGNMFGVANLYADEPPPSIISATEPCEVIFIDGSAFRSVIENDMSAMRAYLAFLSKKIIYLNKEISTFTAGSAEKKLAFFLCENQRNGIFEPSFSMSHLAEMLGVGRASLYRALDSLESEGLIQRVEKAILIPDKYKLSKII
ncbi:MAG: Crp/Fnr family transcriptional regulator [Clostridia bacterium]|nr:Crp/Fnr family transcriptional regulator [Clostridia bacterium]